MQKLFSNSHFPELRRVRQKTSSHCGPAVLEMLLSFIGIDIDQDKFVEAAGVAPKLKIHGMTISETGKAVNKLAPGAAFWFKQNSSLSDLSQVVRHYKYPAG